MTHHTIKSKFLWRIQMSMWPAIQDYAAEKAEHWTAWIARKCHKTHFLRPGHSSPASNTPGLHDGSAEARAILSQDLETDTVASGILRHALDYLKGKDSVNPGMWTREFFGEEELTEEEFEAIKNMDALTEEEFE